MAGILVAHLALQHHVAVLSVPVSYVVDKRHRSRHAHVEPAGYRLYVKQLQQVLMTRQESTGV